MAIHARIPLKRQVKHASFARSDNDALLIRCRLDDGSIGWGEGLPRPYVTGETIESAWEQFGSADLIAGLGASFDGLTGTVELLDKFELPRPSEGVRDC